VGGEGREAGEAVDVEMMYLRDILVAGPNGTLSLEPDPKSLYPLKPPPAFIAVIVVTCVLLVVSVAVNVIVRKKVKGMDASSSIDMRGVELSNAPHFSSRA